MAALSGQTFAGYEIIAKLGEGGFGAVYKARQPNLNRLVALKILAPHLAADAEFVARFKREATLAASLNHPNLVLVYSADTHQQTHYMAMEFVEGETLREHIERQGRLDPRESLAIAVYIAEALKYAWNKSRLVHRDIKPDNVFLSTAGEVKLGDLGLAKNVGQSTAGMTATGMMMGSPHYISPEQANAKKDIDFRADIYSLGCTLYHMLTGKTPYEGDDPMAVMNLHVNSPPPAIFKAWPQCPMPLGLLVGKMLKKNPRERHASYEELLDELRAVHEKLTQARTAAAAPPSGTITFLFTDIEGSTQLWEKHPQAMSIALERHNHIVRRTMESHGGFVFKTVGDAFCVAFASAPNALAAALATQRALAAEPWSETGPLRVRMALHTGVAEARGGDYFGPTLNRVARVLAAGHGGQILMSNATEQLVRDHLSEGASLSDLGERSLKNLTRTERIFQLSVTDLPTTFPTLRAAPSPSTIARRRRQTMLIYGGVGAGALLLLAGLFLWSPWKRPSSQDSNAPPPQDSTTPSLQHSISTTENWQDQMAVWRKSGKIPTGVKDDGGAWVTTKSGVVPHLACVMRDGAVRATFRLPDKKSAVAGLDLRYAKGAGTYQGTVSRESVVINVAKPRDQEQSETSPANIRVLQRWPLPASVDPNQEITLEFRAVGDELSIKVNGQLVGSVRDSTYNREGEVAVYCRETGARVSRIEVLNLDGASASSSHHSTTPSLQYSATSSAAAAFRLLGNVFTNALGAEMVYIPPGEFMLGSTKEEQAWAAANGCSKGFVKPEGESPRKATIRQGFWMERTEVTVGQWKQFAKETGYVTDGEKKGESFVPQEKGKSYGPMKGKSWRDSNFGFEMQDDHAVTCISWNDAVAFCEWLTMQEQQAGRLAHGYKVRLPIEAEWEYACRAGTQTKFWWGDSLEDAKGRGNWAGKDDGFEFVSPVDIYGERGRNRFGLADMLGNLWEWCLDGGDARQAHEELWTGNTNARVLRGGSFYDTPGRYRCATRIYHDPARSDSHLGFRVVVGVDMSGARRGAAGASAAVAPSEGGILAPAETRVSALTTNPKVGEVFTLPLGSNVTMELMGIPPGEFMMGSSKEEQAWAVANGLTEQDVKREGEAPQNVAIKQGFWIGRTEVTVGQWKQFVKETNHVTDAEKRGGADVYQGPEKSYARMKGKSWRDPNFGFELQDCHPVSCVSWTDAVAFCKWLTEHQQKAGLLPTGWIVRLPTEAEWEYACRAGTQTKFWWGDSEEDGKGRLNWLGKEDGYEFVAPVDSYDARGRNRFGLADMLGNVYEWCLDEYDRTQARGDSSTGNATVRVLRGGSFDFGHAACRCANFFSTRPSHSISLFGFRVCVGPTR